VTEFWDDPDRVAQFAARSPDRRLVDWVPQFVHPASVRILDLGAAGGRNTVFLAERGFDVHARDTAPAMVEETRRRTAAVLGEVEADRRVRVGGMDLLDFPDGGFDLVIALGVIQCAPDLAVFEAALAETARVLAPGGSVLVANFTPAMRPAGGPLVPVPDMPGVYDGFSSGRCCLFHAPDLDARFRAHGLEPLRPTETVRVEAETGTRVTANAHYGKRA